MLQRAETAMSRLSCLSLVASLALTTVAASSQGLKPFEPRSRVSGLSRAPATGAAYVFPLKVSSNGRYLIDQNNKPFRIQGDAGWDIAQKVTLAELRTYLDDRQAKGFNTILTYWGISMDYVLNNTTCPGALGASGARPFLLDAAGNPWNGAMATADFSSPNAAYFAWIDTIVAEAAARNMVVLFGALYLGYNNGAADGWWQALNNSKNTQAVSFAFGQFLGNRYKDDPNVIWYLGADMLPAAGSEGETRTLKVLQGIKAAGATQLWTAHYVHEYLSTDESAFAPFMDIEHVYTHGSYPSLGPTYPLARLGYQHTPALPAFLMETTYEGEHGVTAAQIREYMWGAALGAIGGVVFGNNPVWLFDTARNPGWIPALNSTGADDMKRMGALLDLVPWQRLVPSGLAGTSSVVTAGAGTYGSWNTGGSSGGDDYVVAAADASGSAILAYVPSPHTGGVTIDLSLLAAAVHARWYDPTTGASVVIAGSPFPNTSAHAFTVPATAHADGSHDWVLVLETTPTPVELMSFRIE